MEGVTNNFYIQGNYIDKQYVQTQHIGCQYVQSPNSTIPNNTTPNAISDTDCEVIPVTSHVAKKAKPTSKSKPPKVIDTTFKYIYFNSHQIRITNLFQLLLRSKYIDPKTNPDDFLSIFSGEPSNAKIKWLKSQSFLFALIKEIDKRNLIEKTRRPGLWQITQSHFVDKNSRQFSDFNKLRQPKQTKASIAKLVDIIDPSIKEYY